MLPIVVGVMETWFNSSVPNFSLNVPQYSIVHFDRPTLDGDVMLPVGNCCNILCTEQFAFSAIRVLCVDVEYLVTDSRVVRFVSVYRPSNSNMARS